MLKPELFYGRIFIRKSIFVIYNPVLSQYLVKDNDDIA